MIIYPLTLFIFVSVIAVMYFHTINLPPIFHCNRFIDASTVFGVNESAVKLATGFMLLRILRINDEESWSKYTLQVKI